MSDNSDNKNYKALVVDDDEMFRRVLGRQLSRLGFTYSELESGDKVVAMLEAEHFDIIFLDLIMEGQEGIETLIELYELDDRPPVVAVSSQRIYLDNALVMGAEHALIKPVDTADLERIMGELSLT